MLSLYLIRPPLMAIFKLDIISDKILKQKSPYRIISDLRSESGAVLKEKLEVFQSGIS